MSSKALGQKAEFLACKFLQKKGFKILVRNYRLRAGEIDIIAREGETLCFIEVKMRSSRNFGLPQEAVTKEKQRKISFVAKQYLASCCLKDPPMRFDVISIIPIKNSYEILLIKDAF